MKQNILLLFSFFFALQNSAMFSDNYISRSLSGGLHIIPSDAVTYIMSNLDYKSNIQFIRTCKELYSYYSKKHNILFTDRYLNINDYTGAMIHFARKNDIKKIEFLIKLDKEYNRKALTLLSRIDQDKHDSVKRNSINVKLLADDFQIDPHIKSNNGLTVYDCRQYGKQPKDPERIQILSDYMQLKNSEPVQIVSKDASFDSKCNKNRINKNNIRFFITAIMTTFLVYLFAEKVVYNFYKF